MNTEKTPSRAGAYEYTPAQKRALDISQKRNLLVSASAGTGKTTVMVERIKQLIETKREMLKKMLVVTFTKLAAAEMKDKLYVGLLSSDSEYAREQAETVGECSIGTIHSFCSDVVREYFYVVGVDPNFAILEESESLEIHGLATDRVFEKNYKFNGKEFCKLVEKFSRDREDVSLRNDVRSLHLFFAGIEDVEQWSERVAAENTFDKVSGAINSYLVRRSREIKDKAYELTLDFGKAGADYFVDKLSELRENVMANDKCGLSANLANIDEFKKPNFKGKDDAVFYCDDEQKQILIDESDRLLATTEDFLDEVKKIKAADGTVATDAADAEWCRKLVKLALETEKEFSAIKKEKNVLDFSDLEKMTLEILKNEDAREQIRRRFDYVFIDEYQDVNGIQEKIAETLSRGDNLFTVGDVKQSIYGFRQASPDIFADKARKYSVSPECGDVVYMNDNFRCNGSIAEFVNAVFDGVMTDDFGNEDYRGNGILKATKTEKISDGLPPVEICRIYDDGEDADSSPLKPYDITAEQKEKADGVVAQGVYIAEKIKKLVGTKKTDGTAVGFGDIVVLMRSTRTGAQEIYKQLVSHGIPATIKTDDGILTKETGDLLAFFRVLDNKYDDYSLAEVMSGGLGRFSFDEMAKIAKNNRQPSFWQKVVAFSEEEKNADDETAKKCRRLVDLVERYSDLRQVLKAGRILLEVIEETEYERYVLALPNGRVRRSKLFAFAGKVNDMTVGEVLDTTFKNEDFAVGQADEDDVVRIMTIHASKGLEFDVVFIAGAEKTFNGGNRESVTAVFHKEGGIAVKRAVTLGERESLRERFIKMLVEKKDKEEELRLLYVAVTRAKKKLVVVASCDAPSVRAYSVGKTAKRMLDWIAYAAYRLRGGDVCRVESISAVELTQGKNEISDADDDFTFEDEKLSAEIIKQTEWRYCRESDLDLPLKVVSGKLDELAVSFGDEERERSETSFGAINVDDLASADASDDRAQLGTAYHKVFEKIDFSHSEVNDIVDCIDRLVKDGMVESDVAAKINPYVLSRAAANADFKKLLDGGKAYHELPFLSSLPYRELFGKGSDEEIMLQGVIDLLIIKDGCAFVLDYKVTRSPEKIKSRYRLQLNSYRLAVEKYLKIPTRAFVLSVLDGKLTEM